MISDWLNFGVKIVFGLVDQGFFQPSRNFVEMIENDGQQLLSGSNLLAR